MQKDYSCSILDEVTDYNLKNCKTFLGFIDEKYSGKLKPIKVRLYLHRALDCLNLIEKLNIESTFKLKSSSRLEEDIKKLIKNEALLSNLEKHVIKAEIDSAFKKIRHHLKEY